MKRVTASVFLITSSLALPTNLAAQAPVSSTSSSVVKETSPSIGAADVLARAKELYQTEGPKVALPEFEKALALFRKDNDRKNEAITLGLIGNCYKKFGDFPKAEDYLQRALAMKRSIGDRLEEGRTLSHLGLLHWEMAASPFALQSFGHPADSYLTFSRTRTVP